MAKGTTIVAKEIDIPGFFTVAQTAKLLGIAPRTVHKYFDRGLLQKAGSIGVAALLRREDVEAYQASRRPPGNPDMGPGFTKKRKRKKGKTHAHRSDRRR